MKKFFFLITLLSCIGCISDRQTICPDELNLSAMLQPIPDNAVFEDSTYYIWGSSPVKGDDGKYHLFYSRWEKKYRFSAWVTHSEIAHAVPDHLFGPYTHHDVALPERGEKFWDGHTTHNPTIHRFGNKYYLYYMGNRGDRVETKGLNWSHRNAQKIGVAVADSPYGPWKRFDTPLVDASNDATAPDALAVSNPSVVQCPDGKFLMVYKAIGRKNKMPFGGPVVHMTALSDSPTGPFVKNPKLAFTCEGSNFAAEDPYIWVQGRRFYAIVKDMTGVFTHRGRSLALFTSEDGLDWQLAKHPFVSDLNLNWEGGRRDSVFRLERPQVYLEDGLPKALFLAVTPLKPEDNAFNVHIPLDQAHHKTRLEPSNLIWEHKNPIN